jgi:hypothetical protein
MFFSTLLKFWEIIQPFLSKFSKRHTKPVVNLSDQINNFTSIWPLTQWNIFKTLMNFINCIKHMLKFSELKRWLLNEKFWIKLIIWHRTVKASHILHYWQSSTLGSTFRAGPLATLQNGLYIVLHPLETPQKCVWTNVGLGLTFASSNIEYHQFQLQLG